MGWASRDGRSRGREGRRRWGRAAARAARLTAGRGDGPRPAATPQGRPPPSAPAAGRRSLPRRPPPAGVAAGSPPRRAGGRGGPRGVGVAPGRRRLPGAGGSSRSGGRREAPGDESAVRRERTALPARTGGGAPTCTSLCPRPWPGGRWPREARPERPAAAQLPSAARWPLKAPPSPGGPKTETPEPRFSLPGASRAAGETSSFAAKTAGSVLRISRRVVNSCPRGAKPAGPPGTHDSSLRCEGSPAGSFKHVRPEPGPAEAAGQGRRAGLRAATSAGSARVSAAAAARPETTAAAEGLSSPCAGGNHAAEVCNNCRGKKPTLFL